MNLFVTDKCPAVSARALDDKRIGKLLMEANQMLSLAVKLHDPDCSQGWEEGEGLLSRGLAHKNHPVSIWVRSNRATFDWCLIHAEALASEWLIRFDKVHASGYRTPYLRGFRHCLPVGELLPFQNSARNEGMGIDYSHLPVTQAYREYLAHRWDTDTNPVAFTNRGEPEWLSSIQCV